MKARPSSKPQSLGLALDAWLAKSGLAKRLDVSQVVDRWADVVGPQVALVTRAEAVNAGNPFLVPPGTGAAGVYAPSSLESSTVDLGTEFTNMIITQRAFSAGTRVITTADEMLDELVRIKR